MNSLDKTLSFLILRYVQIRKTMEYTRLEQDRLKDIDGIRRSIHNKIGDIFVTKGMAKNREEGRKKMINLYFELQDKIKIPETTDIFYEQSLAHLLT